MTTTLLGFSIARRPGALLAAAKRHQAADVTFNDHLRDSEALHQGVPVIFRSCTPNEARAARLPKTGSVDSMFLQANQPDTPT